MKRKEIKSYDFEVSYENNLAIDYLASPFGELMKCP